MRVEDSVSSPGGGAMPEVEIPTACVAVSHSRLRAEELDERLRTGVHPVVGRVAKGRLLLDMRTVGEDDVAVVAEALAAAAGGASPLDRD
jgi:L-seryl-tRNA(Ser) seleniumtransferase